MMIIIMMFLGVLENILPFSFSNSLLSVILVYPRLCFFSPIFANIFCVTILKRTYVLASFHVSSS